MFEERIAAIRAELTGTHAAQWRRLHEQCEWYRRQKPPAEHPTASITYFGPAAASLALAYRLTGQQGYLDEARRWISTCVGYPHWGKANMPDHDLDAGWLLHGLSLAYAWLGDDAVPGLRDKLELQGRRLFDFAVETEGTWWSSSYWQNHNWICYAGLATAGYALGRPEWTERARANFEAVFSLMPSDGSDAEGVVYWRYGVPWLAVYADLLEEAEGKSLWTHGDFLRNTFRWRLHQCAPGLEENVDHGDCHDRRSGHSVALYYKLASVYGLGEAQWLADTVAERFFWREAYESGVKPGILAEAYLELLWYDPSLTPVEPVERVAYFPDLGQVTARTGWHRDATFVSFKSAPGGGHRAWETSHRIRDERGWETLNAGHHHPDAGSFTLASHGAFLAVDDGYCNAKRAAHHNLVLVDGQGWDGEGSYDVYRRLPRDRTPIMRDVFAEDGFVHATSETAAMFAPSLGVRRCDRTLVVTPHGRVVVLDLLEADEPREWTMLLHADWPHDTRALVSGPGQVWVRRFLPETPEVTYGTTLIEANPTSSTPSLSITRTLHTSWCTQGPSREAAFLTVLEPTSSLDPVPSTAEAVGGFGVRFTGPDETVLLSPVERRITEGGFDTDAAAVIVSEGRTVVVEGVPR